MGQSNWLIAKKKKFTKLNLEGNTFNELEMMMKLYQLSKNQNTQKKNTRENQGTKMEGPTPKKTNEPPKKKTDS
jgi:hypothetical protein